MDAQRLAEEKVVDLRRVLEEIIGLAREAQGDWSPVSEAYAPLWTHAYKEIANTAELALEESESAK